MLITLRLRSVLRHPPPNRLADRWAYEVASSWAESKDGCCHDS